MSIQFDFGWHPNFNGVKSSALRDANRELTQLNGKRFRDARDGGKTRVLRVNRKGGERLRIYVPA